MAPTGLGPVSGYVRAGWINCCGVLGLEEQRNYGSMGGPDYCEWEGGVAPLWAYKAFVKAAVAARSLASWRNAVAAHDRPISYSALATAPSTWPSLLLQVPVPWDVLVGHVSLARIRAGLVEVAHVRGRRSNASIRTCIGCGCNTRSSYLHSLTMCPAWALDVRATWEDMRDVGMTLLNAQPGSKLFDVAARRAARIEHDVNAFWSARG